MRSCSLSHLARFLLIAVAFASLAGTVSAGEASADPAEPETAAESEPQEEVPLKCERSELIEPIDTWSVDCVAKWAENMKYPDLKAAFLGNKVDGPQLTTMTMARLSSEYDVSDETEQKQLFYAIKDVMKKDSYQGNTNNWAQFFMWCLPLLAIYKYLTMRYERQLAKLAKKYNKWQEGRNPTTLTPLRVNGDGTNEWIEGMNADVAGDKVGKKKEKRTKKAQ